MSIGLSFGESGSADRPRSLTSAVQERLHTMPYRYPDEPGLHYEEWVVRNRIFHRALFNACGSQWLLGFRDILHEQSERYRRLSIRRDIEKSRNVEAEHTAIVAATLKRDADAAVAALSKHFMKTMRLVELATSKASGSIEAARPSKTKSI